MGTALIICGIVIAFVAVKDRDVPAMVLAAVNVAIGAAIYLKG